MGAYSAKAQPFLNAIADAVFASEAVRAWLIAGTPHQAAYTPSEVLVEEQRAVRWRQRQTKQPFWANYFCGLDKRCTCRIPGSRSLESDAIFFLRNEKARVLAVHVEFKHPREDLGFGQPEGYPLRAACFAATWPKRPALNAHSDWTTAVFCGDESLEDDRLTSFQRIIGHREAAEMISGYPAVRTR